MNMLRRRRVGRCGSAAPDIGVPTTSAASARPSAFRPETVVIGDGGQVAGRIRIVEDLGSEASSTSVIDHEGEGVGSWRRWNAPFGGSPGDNGRVGLPAASTSSTLRR